MLRNAFRRSGRLEKALAAGIALLLIGNGAFAQRAGGDGEEQRSSGPTIDPTTGTKLNEAIELLNQENYAAARAKIGELRMDRLSPYERSRVEQILFSIAYQEENYDDARSHLEQAIAAGGLNEQEISQARYQIAQIFMAEERWAEGAQALENWFQSAANPNSAAYYLLAVAYYQLEQYDKALPAAEKAVELAENPQESWLQLVLALYIQDERFRDALPLLERLVAMAPDRKTYWVQLSSIYGQLEDYPKALATMQLAYNAGLLTEDSEYRRLADLLMFNEVPYRGGQILEKAIAEGKVNGDAQAYEKLANCWIAAREFDKAIAPLERAASMSQNGDLYVRLGEVHIQRENWDAAVDALQRGLDKGGLRDTSNAELLMGISLYSQERYRDARPWFERAARSEARRQTARGYLQLIEAKLSS
ncbi:MAG TPA: tetratricopeptide repeat protein [Gammaproteobacteria bacterium]